MNAQSKVAFWPLLSHCSSIQKDCDDNNIRKDCGSSLVLSAGCYICTHSVVFVTRFDSAMSAGMCAVCVCVIYTLAFRVRVRVSMVAAFYSLR